MGTVPSPSFQGQSKYASDFQQVLTRAVAIASLPLQGLTNEVSTLTAQQSALNSLSSTFTSLQTAIQNLGAAATSVQAVSSNSSEITASATNSALPGTYTVSVGTLGSETTTISNPGSPVVTDPTSGNISSSSSYTLTINGTGHTITPTGSSLDDLASAINNSGLAVQATVVNVGTNASPDYRLSVTSNNLAADTLQLNDGSTDLLTQIAPGAPTSLTINGVPTTSNSSQVTLAPGVTINILQSTATPVTVRVSQNNTGLSNSLQGFVSAYNSARDAINGQYGQNAGPLSGDSIVLSLSQVLDSLTQYSGGTSGLTSLATLGVTVDPTGHLTFDPTALAGMSNADVQGFLGSATTGGFLQAATNQMNEVTDPTAGLFTTSLASISAQIGDENSLISQETDRINQMTATLQQKLSAADATISVLQTQFTYMSGLFAALYPNSSSTSTSSSTGA